MGYVAGKKLKLKGEVIMPGEPVPDAVNWKRPNVWVEAGWLVWDGRGTPPRGISYTARKRAEAVAQAPQKAPEPVAAAAEEAEAPAEPQVAKKKKRGRPKKSETLADSDKE